MSPHIPKLYPNLGLCRYTAYSSCYGFFRRETSATVATYWWHWAPDFVHSTWPSPSL